MKDLILLNPQTSAKFRWNPPANFSFLRELPLLPVQAAEAGRVASALPLAICKDARQPSGWGLMAVCGPAAGHNAMVDGDKWLAKVVPDSIRYLPFAIQDLGGGKGVAAIDPNYAKHVFAFGAEGQPLHGEDGKLHEAAAKRVEFLQGHQPRIQRTQQILTALDQAGLITPWPQQIASSAGITLEGLHTIDEKKLSQLDDTAFLTLRKGGALAVAYSCLLSLYQLRNLRSPEAAKPDSTTAVQTTGDIDLEFLNDSDTIKFGPN